MHRDAFVAICSVLNFRINVKSANYYHPLLLMLTIRHITAAGVVAITFRRGFGRDQSSFTTIAAAVHFANADKSC